MIKHVALKFTAFIQYILAAFLFLSVMLSVTIGLDAIKMNQAIFRLPTIFKIPILGYEVVDGCVATRPNEKNCHLIKMA